MNTAAELLEQTKKANIPEKMKQNKKWALTLLNNGQKMPIDATSILKADTIVAYSKEDGCKLVTYDVAIAAMEQNLKSQQVHTLAIAYYMEQPEKYIIVDVEPDGMKIERNPYVKLPYLYREYSRNGGLHGIMPNTLLPNDYIRKRTRIKDDNFVTELMINKHFLTFTGNEITDYNKNIVNGIKNYESYEQMIQYTERKENYDKFWEYIKKIAPETNELNQTEHSSQIKELLERRLFDKEVLFCLDVVIPRIEDGNTFNSNGDLSEEEARLISFTTNIIMREYPELIANDDIDAFHNLIAPLVYFCVDATMPSRKKHDEMFTYKGEQFISKKHYTIYKVSKYTFENRK